MQLEDLPLDVLPKVCSGLGSADKKLLRLASHEWKKIVTEVIHFLDIDARDISAEDIQNQLQALPRVNHVHMALETQAAQASQILAPGIPPRLRSLQIFLSSSCRSIMDAYGSALASATALTSLDITWEPPRRGEIDHEAFALPVLQAYPCLAAPLISLRHLGVRKGHPLTKDTLSVLAGLPHLNSLTHPGLRCDAAAAELTGLTALTRLHVFVEHASIDMRPIGKLTALKELTLSVQVWYRQFLCVGQRYFCGAIWCYIPNHVVHFFVDPSNKVLEMTNEQIKVVFYVEGHEAVQFPTKVMHTKSRGLLLLCSLKKDAGDDQ